MILGKKNILLYGKDFYNRFNWRYQYKISLNSFFQVNNVQTKILYDKIVEFADFKGDENVLDLYCGIGSIGLYIIASKVKKGSWNRNS